MQAVILAFVGGAALAAVSAQAAPLAPTPLVGPVTYILNQEWAPLPNDAPSLAPVGAAQPVELVSQGCGWGWHRHHWRDHCGYWHCGDCAPNGELHSGWGARGNHP